MERRSTIIWYDVKEELELSLNEYVVMDLIERGSPGTRGRSAFACMLSKVSMAEYLGMSKSGVFRIVERLVEKGLVLRGKKHQRDLLVTDKWYDANNPFRIREKQE